MAEDSERVGVELAAGGRRFARAETERAFIAWQIARTLPFNRAANASAAIGLSVAAVALAPFAAHVPPVVMVMVGGLAASSIALALAYRHLAVGPWIPVAVAGTNALFGLAVVAIDAIYLDALELSAGVASFVAFFAFTVSRTRPWMAALGAASYLSLDGAMIAGAMFEGHIPMVRGALEIGLLLVAFVAGVRAAWTIDADARTTFRQERIIEAQRATIERQQELLKRELSHQVAERSRELGAVLARSDVMLDARRLLPGERFAERYKVVSALGAGGMGAVYEVERVTDQQRLALKAVVGDVSGALAARFAREAEIGARVRHPNLVPIVDVGVSTGVPFLVMQLVEGGSLEAHRSRFGDVEWALPILHQIAEGLAALHDAGVVHRDLKPANVLLDDGVAKISDFGISRFGSIDDAGEIDPNASTMSVTPKRTADLTATNMVMGTPLYLAPEGAKTARALDARADVFAFGIIAYEMLTGQSPFGVPAFLLAMADQPIPEPAAIDDAHVSEPLRARLLDCLRGDPARRPKVRALRDALTR